MIISRADPLRQSAKTSTDRLRSYALANEMSARLEPLVPAYPLTVSGLLIISACGRATRGMGSRLMEKPKHWDLTFYILWPPQVAPGGTPVVQTVQQPRV